MNVKRMACALGSITLAALVPAALLVAALLVVQPVLAQPATGPDVKPVAIQEINTAAFPMISTTVVVRGEAQQHLERIRLLEDGNEQNVDFTVADGGPLAVAILLDLSPYAQEEMGDIRRLVGKFAAQLPEDTLYALYQATDAEPRGVKLPSAYPGPFYPDRNALVNHLTNYIPDGPDDTPLLEMVQSIQSQFPADSSGRHIVVFTGSVPSSGTTDLGTILAGCQNGVQVHAVLVAPDAASAGNADMLAGMTKVCSGANTLFGDPNAADALHQLMVKPAGMVTLVYRTQQSKPRFLRVEVPDGNNGSHFDGREFPPLKEVRVSIDIHSPAVGRVFTATEPIQLDVEVAVTPYALRIAKVEYAIDGGRMLPLTESGAGFSAVLPTLDAGTHKLVLRATDELGNQNVDNVERTIEVAAAPPPPPDNLWIVAAIALAAIVGAAALSALAWKWWGGRPKSQDLAAAPAFQLVLVEPLPKAPKTIALDNETIVLGRDAAYATNVLEDDRISRKQCTIQRSNGKYLVQNNSATNATELDGQPLKKDERAVAMQPGAVLTLGPAKYRFDAVGVAIDPNLTRDMNALNGPALTKKMPASAFNTPQQPPNGQPLAVPPLSALTPRMQPANGQAPAVIQNHVH